MSGGYNNEKYTIQASISNKNLTSYNPTLTLTAPTGFSFSSASGSGTYTKVNARTITWNPKLTSKIGTATLDMEFDVNVTYPSGSSSYSGTFTLVESLYSTTESFSATITERPPTPSEEDDDSYTPIIDDDTINKIEYFKIKADEEVEIHVDTIAYGVVMFGFPVDENHDPILSGNDTPFEIYHKNVGSSSQWRWDTVTTYHDDDYHGRFLQGTDGKIRGTQLEDMFLKPIFYKGLLLILQIIKTLLL